MPHVVAFVIVAMLMALFAPPMHGAQRIGLFTMPAMLAVLAVLLVDLPPALRRLTRRRRT